MPEILKVMLISANNRGVFHILECLCVASLPPLISFRAFAASSVSSHIFPPTTPVKNNNSVRLDERLNCFLQAEYFDLTPFHVLDRSRYFARVTINKVHEI